MTTTLLITCISAIASLTAAIASVIGALRRKKIEDLQMQLDKDKAEVYRAQNETYIKERGRKYVEPLYL